MPLLRRVMAAKVTKVALMSAAGEEEFAIEVAEELLSWPRSGWRLADGSGYEYADGRLVRKQNVESSKLVDDAD